MARRSAGLLLHRPGPGGPEVLLVHPGGPFWAGRDDGAWSIPKGELLPGEDPLDAARREFAEELGREPPPGEPVSLGETRQSRNKWVAAWALAGDLDVTAVESNTFELQWPPRSGRMREFPEVDRAEWLDLDTARRKLLPGQLPLLDALAELLTGR